MAEYKTYKCDSCGTLDAIHLVFPKVDETIDPVDVKYYNVPGGVHLCAKCMPIKFEKALKNHNMDIQRQLWKAMLGK